MGEGGHGFKQIGNAQFGRREKLPLGKRKRRSLERRWENFLGRERRYNMEKRSGIYSQE